MAASPRQPKPPMRRQRRCVSVTGGPPVLTRDAKPKKTRATASTVPSPTPYEPVSAADTLPAGTVAMVRPVVAARAGATVGVDAGAGAAAGDTPSPASATVTRTSVPGTAAGTRD